MLGGRQIERKTNADILAMRAAGLVVADALAAMQAAIEPGITTAEVDSIARRVIRQAGATPSFLGYGSPPYPAAICASVNEEIVHGIPGARTLAAGDVVSIDCGAILDGWHGDAAFTAIVGGTVAVSRQVQDLVATAEMALWHGISAFRPGGRLNDIGSAIDDFVDERYGIPQDYGGHGIGRQMHQVPHVYNYRTHSRGPRLEAGMCLAIEPMLTLGAADTNVAVDQWTVLTSDARPAAHWEHTVALHSGGLWVLTAPDGGHAGLASVGLATAPLD